MDFRDFRDDLARHALPEVVCKRLELQGIRRYQDERDLEVEEQFGEHIVLNGDGRFRGIAVKDPELEGVAVRQNVQINLRKTHDVLDVGARLFQLEVLDQDVEVGVQTFAVAYMLSKQFVLPRERGRWHFT